MIRIIQFFIIGNGSLLLVEWFLTIVEPSAIIMENDARPTNGIKETA